MGSEMCIRDRHKGWQKALILITQLLFCCLIFVIYTLLVVFAVDHLDIMNLSGTSFINNSLVNPVGVLLRDLMSLL